MIDDDKWLEDPIKSFRDIQKEFQRQFQSIWQPLQSFPVDMIETDKEVIVRADLPGFKKQDLQVEATEKRILIHAKRKEERTERGKYFYRKERKSGEIRRVLDLPTEVKPEKSKLEFKDGVLEIKLPKKEISKKKKFRLL